ncbi:unnamed protein product [Sphagnum troendelagicum]
MMPTVSSGTCVFLTLPIAEESVNGILDGKDSTMSQLLLLRGGFGLGQLEFPLLFWLIRSRFSPAGTCWMLGYWIQHERCLVWWLLSALKVDDEEYFILCRDSDDYGSDDYGITKKTPGNHAEMQSLDAENTVLFRNVLDVIEEGGDLKKLKVDDLKTYLRYYGLHMIGNKATLIERIKEHLVVKDGGGEAKYRRSMFSLNCTGDVVQGDVVLFEQKVYHSYDFVSRSAAGPPLGKRMVAGCVVSDSYCATKQQHTFTIKGQNLYRLRTYRQPWLNEEDRQSALVEKHGQGVAARNIWAAAKAQHSHKLPRRKQTYACDQRTSAKKLYKNP